MWETKGQDRVVGFLCRSLEQGRLAHAYLLVGPEAVGKATLARDLARAVNCQGEEPPCGECRPCRRIAQGQHPDVMVVSLATPGGDGEGRARRDIGIDQVRELQRWVALKPFEGRCRVFIVDGAENLNAESANALLKTLEEPPPQVLLLLLAVDEQRLPPTVVSRCQRLELWPLPWEGLAHLLMQDWQIPRYRAEELAWAAEGRLGLALAALEDESRLEQWRQERAYLLHLAQAHWEERLEFAASLAGRFARERAQVMRLLERWAGLWRHLMLVKMGITVSRDWSGVEAAALEEATAGLSLSQILTFLQSLTECRRHLALNANPQLALEVLVLGLSAPATGRSRPLRPMSRKEDEGEGVLGDYGTSSPRLPREYAATSSRSTLSARGEGLLF